MNLKKRTWEIVECAAPSDKASQIFDYSILSLVLLNVITVIIGSIQSVHLQYRELLYGFETISVIVFTIEYLLRLWSCTADDRFKGSIKGRVHQVTMPLPIIDLLSILPFYLPFLGIDLRCLRVLRLLRILRIAKIGRYYSSLSLIKHVFQEKKEELILTTVMMGFLLIISSCLLYYIENPVQPESFSSIPATMWWSVATLTTVGYGDMYPVTQLGKICASVIAILGIGMFALPTGILGAGFVEAVKHEPDPKGICPHCGKKLE